MENKHALTYHGSPILFVIKLIAVILVTDAAYSLLSAFLLGLIARGMELPFDLHHHTAILLMVLALVKTVFQIWIIIRIAVKWTTSAFSITETHLIKHEGFFTNQQTIYDRNLIRSVMIHQSLLGRLLRYGTIIIDFSASGGYIDSVALTGIPKPQQIEQFLRHQ